jgi:hypothetical protein
MFWTIDCPCGAEIRALTEAELVDAAQRHVAEAHPVVGTPPDAADVLSMARETPAD